MAIGLDGFVRKKTKITIGTKDFTFTELSLADFAEFRARMQEQRNEFNQQRRQRLIEDAKKLDNINSMELLKFADKPLTEEEVEAEMETVEGLGFLVYLSLRYEQPGIEIKQAMEITTMSEIEKISNAMFPSFDESKKKRTRAPVKK